MITFYGLTTKDTKEHKGRQGDERLKLVKSAIMKSTIMRTTLYSLNMVNLFLYKA
jgi:hypothetical protein